MKLKKSKTGFRTIFFAAQEQHTKHHTKGMWYLQQKGWEGAQALNLQTQKLRSTSDP